MQSFVTTCVLLAILGFQLFTVAEARAAPVCVEVLQVTNRARLYKIWRWALKMEMSKTRKTCPEASLQTEFEKYLAEMLACALSEAYGHVIQFRSYAAGDPGDCDAHLEAEFLLSHDFPKIGNATLKLRNQTNRKEFSKVLIKIPEASQNDEALREARSRGHELLFGDLLARELTSAASDQVADGSRLKVLDHVKIEVSALVHSNQKAIWIVPATHQRSYSLTVANMLFTVTTPKPKEYRLPLCWALEGYLGGPLRPATTDDLGCPNRPNKAEVQDRSQLEESKCDISILRMSPQ